MIVNHPVHAHRLAFARAIVRRHVRTQSRRDYRIVKDIGRLTARTVRNKTDAEG
jgi:hypothetical protein